MNSNLPLVGLLLFNNQIALNFVSDSNTEKNKHEKFNPIFNRIRFVC